MVSDEDMKRFHNGDTLDSIPVIRPHSPPPRVIPWRTVGGLLGTVALVGAVFGWAFGMGSRDVPSATLDSPVSPAPMTTSAPPSPTPSTVPPAPRVTVTATQTVEPAPMATEPRSMDQSYDEPYMEQVYISVTPYTGGDPSMDYCLAYTGEYTNDAPMAVLLVNAYSYECHDFLFSTHPGDGGGVFEETPPDCSATPGGRTALLWIGEETAWGESLVYTCLLLNDSI